MVEDSGLDKDENEPPYAGSGTNSRKLSTTGESLYKLLNVEKGASNDEIKKSYRKLALKYHPDKNQGNPEAAETFKEINRAHAVLTDEQKREIYDKYGSRGLHLLDQMGPEAAKVYFALSNPVSKAIFIFCTIITGCWCCCCCCCCCNCCCGKCKPDMSEEEANLFGTGQEGENDGVAANGTSEKPPVTTQPHATTESTPLSADGAYYGSGHEED
ncbi:dnaJ homolog subfamily C member 5-like isoform X2 [Convolutriloba macropyga]|uniref:dnaJ homolog subfamily C member 5-like isoform X2 n=1 Tax=Convolutriloba macropyga TaxID=536237 RepID=UPI003F526BCB